MKLTVERRLKAKIKQNAINLILKDQKVSRFILLLSKMESIRLKCPAYRPCCQ
jgi:hypothetical protein